MQVIIDTAGDILYKSFYLLGLTEIFGLGNIRFSAKPFKGIPYTLRNDKVMNFIVREGLSEKRFTIACNDQYTVVPELYDWCDLYGSVNANRALTEEQHRAKLVALCPSFAVRYAPTTTLARHALRCLPTNPARWKKHVGKYRRLLLRNAYSQYESASNVRDNYIFTCSTLWYNDEWNRNDETVNLDRATFIRTCRSIEGLTLEGGLVSQGAGRSSEELFCDCLCQPYSPSQWLDLTRQSVCVFNTPAFWQCHGWKLGEYMALGKAIVSTPLFNDLPEPLVNGTHYHLTDRSAEGIRDAVRHLLQHPDYRQHLEHNITDYWQRYGTPKASLAMLGITR